MKKNVPICENHLSELYQAVKAGDISLMDKIEHELTEEEKCVACTYVFKTHGTVKEALEHFLNDGSAVGVIEEETSKSLLAFWGLRLSILFVILGIDFFLAAALRVLFFRQAFALFSLSILGYTTVGLTSLVAFLFVDDVFFD